jgi:hypothetical protein
MRGRWVMDGMGRSITTQGKDRGERIMVHLMACDGRDARG